MGVQSRMQQENQHGEQRDEAAAEQAIRQQPAEPAGGEKERVGEQVAAQVYGAGVFRIKKALDNCEGDLEGDAVISVGVILAMQRVFIPQNVV